MDDRFLAEVSSYPKLLSVVLETMTDEEFQEWADAGIVRAESVSSGTYELTASVDEREPESGSEQK